MLKHKQFVLSLHEKIEIVVKLESGTLMNNITEAQWIIHSKECEYLKEITECRFCKYRKY